MVLHQHKVRLMKRGRFLGICALLLMLFVNLHVRQLRSQAQNALADQCRSSRRVCKSRKPDSSWTEVQCHKRRIPGEQTAFGTSRFRSEEHTSELQSHVNLVCR